jgi:hypothetical protein
MSVPKPLKPLAQAEATGMTADNARPAGAAGPAVPHRGVGVDVIQAIQRSALSRWILDAGNDLELPATIPDS